MMSGILTLIIRFYRQFISPLKMPCCGFFPHVAEISLAPIKNYGPIKGPSLPIRRFLNALLFVKSDYIRVPKLVFFFQLDFL